MHYKELMNAVTKEKRKAKLQFLERVSEKAKRLRDVLPPETKTKVHNAPGAPTFRLLLSRRMHM